MVWRSSIEAAGRTAHQALAGASGRLLLLHQPGAERSKMILKDCVLPGQTLRARQDSNPRPAA